MPAARRHSLLEELQVLGARHQPELPPTRVDVRRVRDPDPPANQSTPATNGGGANNGSSRVNTITSHDGPSAFTGHLRIPFDPA